MTLQLSDALSRLSGFFRRYEVGELVLPPAQASELRRCLRAAEKRARELEDLERDRDLVLVRAALEAPDTNVVLFPLIPRSASDRPFS